MTCHPQDQVASDAAIKGDRAGAGRPLKAGWERDRRIQDMLEDDDVREALRLSHVQRPASSGPASV
jgi:hypothetical protein